MCKNANAKPPEPGIAEPIPEPIPEPIAEAIPELGADLSAEPEKRTGEPPPGVAHHGSSPAKRARTSQAAIPPLSWDRWRPGLRVAVAVSGGADSVALLRALAQVKAERGLVLSVAHMHHGIRGAEADADAAFVEALAAGLGLRVHRKDVETPAVARDRGLGLEEAARTLRYGWFRELLRSGGVDAVATAHTLNDQAETVLHKLIRGAWTEGLSGIHPVLQADTAGEEGLILRPLLGATREQIVTWLTAIGQTWSEDSTNRNLQFTRNRIRHQLLPQLATFNPKIAHQMAQVATIAREEEAYWQKEVDRLLPGLLLPGRAVRGGGRATSTQPGQGSLAIEVERLRALHPALVRRLLRAVARELGVALDFEQTGRLVGLVEGSASANPHREELTGELRAERTPRELRLLFSARDVAIAEASTASSPAVEIPVPGEGTGFGWRVRCSLLGHAPSETKQPAALLRAALPADKVQLRYSRGAPKRVKEVLERMGIAREERGAWPVLVWQGQIVWMRGAVLEPTPMSALITIKAEPLG